MVFILAVSFVFGAVASAFDGFGSRRETIPKFWLYAGVAAFGALGGILFSRRVAAQFIFPPADPDERVFAAVAAAAFVLLVLVLNRLWSGRRK